MIINYKSTGMTLQTNCSSKYPHKYKKQTLKLISVHTKKLPTEINQRAASEFQPFYA
jgi:hypothetical protein